MNVGDLVRIKKDTFLVPHCASIGIIIDVWVINSYRWLRVMWDFGGIDATVAADVEVVSEGSEG